MRVLICPDSFKGSLSSRQACDVMARGVRCAFPDAEVVTVPLADGGEGTLDALLQGANGQERSAPVQNANGETVTARWGFLPDGRGVIEMAQASGLTLISPERRDAARASSFGTGQLLLAALNAGCRDLILGIGGSATTDGGAGALTALGFMLRDENDVQLEPGGTSLARLHSIDARFADPRLSKIRITILCDVTNPLAGEQGAARVYGPQKGATSAQVEALDAALSHFADVVAKTTGRDERNASGAGAAGGIGFGLKCLSGARVAFAPGIEAVLEAVDFSEKLRDCDLVLTGEGALDAQTLSGKTVAGVCRRAQIASVPVWAFGGAVRLSGAQMNELGLQSAWALPNAPMSLQECIDNAARLLEDAVERALRTWR